MSRTLTHTANTTKRSRMAALRGRIGAFRLHAKRDARETTARGREAFLARFEREVDPDGVLDATERARRAAAARKAYFILLAYRSVVARAAGTKKAGTRS